MHDIRAIRENPEAFDAAMARRGVSGASAEILKVDEARRAKILAAETAQADQNKAAKEVGAAKAKGDEAEFERLRAAVADKKAEVTAMQAEAKELDAQLTDQLARIANLPADDVPEGSHIPLLHDPEPPPRGRLPRPACPAGRVPRRNSRGCARRGSGA